MRHVHAHTGGERQRTALPAPLTAPSSNDNKVAFPPALALSTETARPPQTTTGANATRGTQPRK